MCGEVLFLYCDEYNFIMKLLRIFFAIIIVFCCSFTILHGKKILKEENQTEESEEYQGIISVWQIDGFEGGIGSRKQFLLKVARSFEKEYNGVLVMVTNITKQGAEDNIKNGIYPDMISFSNGVDISGMCELNVLKDFIGGMIGGVSYAVSWCRGGYVLIENPAFYAKKDIEKNSIVVSQGEYTQPVLAMCFDDLCFENIEILSPMDAYVKFVMGKSKYFLGTQRDVNRLQTRKMEINTTPIVKYNDLYQYISIVSKSELKRFYAEKFIEYLISEKTQQKLSDIGMMSCYYNVKFDNEHLNQIQLTKNQYTLSAFTHSEDLKYLHDISLLWAKGNKDAENKIKNVLIKS